VLFDEIEKASDSLWNLLLGILDKGSLTLGTNDKVDFTKTVIIMTSNVGATELSDDKSLGFTTAGEKLIDDGKMEEIAKGAARRKFMPEFLNRLDEIVIFKTLRKAELAKILKFELEKVQKRIVYDSTVMFELHVTETGLEQLIAAGYDKRYNARHLVRAVDKHLTAPLTRLVATKQVNPMEVIVANYTKAKDAWTYTAFKKGEMKSGM
jgi:ATP-dependent Clp protease ATP-binding subunit ClpB